MPRAYDFEKPDTIINAQRALWLWTFYTCALGIYQTKKMIPDFQNMLLQAQGLVDISFSATQMMQVAVAAYMLIAIVSGYVILAMNKPGKHWTRSSALWSVIIQAGCEVLSFFIEDNHSIAGYIPDIPDYGLQMYAVYLMYSWPGSGWFELGQAEKKG